DGAHEADERDEYVVGYDCGEHRPTSGVEGVGCEAHRPPFIRVAPRARALAAATADETEVVAAADRAVPFEEDLVDGDVAFVRAAVDPHAPVAHIGRRVELEPGAHGGGGGS